MQAKGLLFPFPVLLLVPIITSSLLLLIWGFKRDIDITDAENWK